MSHLNLPLSVSLFILLISAFLVSASCPGCPEDSPVDEEIVAAAAHATASLSGISDSGCGGIKLVKVENAQKQVVAGTNYFLTLRLETKGGQGCAEKTEKICQNIVVFKPLPFACQSQNGCLELSRQDGISCKEVKPAVCKNVINGEDRVEEERWTAADGCNTCRCLKSGIPGCTKKFCLDKPLITTSSPIRGTTQTNPLIKKRLSGCSVSQCVERIKTSLEGKGFRIFTTVDHSSNAAGVGLVLRPTTVIIFGNPNVGTKLMQCVQEFAIDLPQKLLVYEDAEGGVWAAINSQVALAEKHKATACQALIQKINGKLSGLLNSL